MNTNVVLPDYFPLAPKYCAKPASAFFECFTQQGEQQDAPVSRTIDATTTAAGS